MKIYIFDGGPRKGWNTAQMCGGFARGASEAGAEVETVRLYDLDFNGCRSCFACKLKGGPSFGRCGWRDGATDLLAAASQADGLAFASPVYLGTITPPLHAFIERLTFQFISYGKGYPVLSPKKPETAMIYTMNTSERYFDEHYERADGPLAFFENFIGRAFTKPERVCAFNTYQFTDYSKYDAGGWDETEKAEWKKNEFPKELRAAYEAGARMAEKIKAKRQGA